MKRLIIAILLFVIGCIIIGVIKQDISVPLKLGRS